MRTPSNGNAPPPDGANETPKPDTPRDAGAATAPNVDGRPSPRLPHERDESSDSGAGAPSEVMRRAHDDVASGKRGTDKGDATDAVYERNFRGRTPGHERD